jgi:hypothetical protein
MFGRPITPADDLPGAPPVVVLGHQFWTERFAANPAAIGQQIKLNDVFFTIIGVTPPQFKGTLQVGQDPKVTVPLAFEPTLLGERTCFAKEKSPAAGLYTSWAG